MEFQASLGYMRPDHKASQPSSQPTKHPTNQAASQVKKEETVSDLSENSQSPGALGLGTTLHSSVDSLRRPHASLYSLQLFLHFFIVSLAFEFFFQLLETEGFINSHILKEVVRFH